MDERMKEMRRAAVVRAALRWWRGGKPIAWSYTKHLYNPTVNATMTSESEQLARACARLAASRKRKAKR